MNRANRPLSAQSAWQVLSVSGELDLATAPRLRDQVAYVAATPAGNVVLDLTEVTFMDCTALGVLVQARVTLGDRLWLRGLPRPVLRLLALTGLEATFALLPAVPPAAAAPDPHTGGVAAAGVVPGPASRGAHADGGVPVASGRLLALVRTAKPVTHV